MSFQQSPQQKQQSFKTASIVNYKRTLKGFSNPGARCYQNSLFQSLFNIPYFQYFLMNFPIKEDDTNILFLLRQLYLSLIHNNPIINNKLIESIYENLNDILHSEVNIDINNYIIELFKQSTINKDFLKENLEFIKKIMLSTIINEDIKKKILKIFYLNDLEKINLLLFLNEQQINLNFKELITEDEEIDEEIDETEGIYNKLKNYYKSKKDDLYDFSNYENKQEDNEDFFRFIYINIGNSIMSFKDEARIKYLKEKIQIFCKKDNPEYDIFTQIYRKLLTNDTFKNFNEMDRLFSVFIIDNFYPMLFPLLQKEKYIKYNLFIEPIIQLPIIPNLNLNELLEQYTNIEPNNVFKYQQFGQTQNRQIFRQNTFMYLSNILCIQLKRFEYNISLKEVKKLKDNIMIPLEIDLKGYINHNFLNLNSKTNYILCSAVLHIGNSANHGHYITINRDMKNLDDFYVYNDKIITKLDNYNDNIIIPGINKIININNSAYLLFYIKV